MPNGSTDPSLALREASRITLPDPVAAMIVFACGERVATFGEQGAQRIIDTSSATVTMSLDASRERIWVVEADGPLMVIGRGVRPARILELWNVLMGAKVATLLDADDDDRAYGAGMIGGFGFAMIRHTPTVGGPRDRTILRFDRLGRALPELSIEERGRQEIFGGSQAPSLFWDPAFRDIVSVDFETGARTVLETDADEPIRPAGRAIHWTRSASRTHLARFASGPGRGCVWDERTGARAVGPWTGRDLRHLFFAGDAVCSVARDSTFTTYAITGEELARGGLATAEAQRPRPCTVDDQHVATVTPDARGISVWDVLRGVEVARRETIEGLEQVAVLSGRGGRIAVAGGSTLVCFDLGAPL